MWTLYWRTMEQVKAILTSSTEEKQEYPPRKVGAPWIHSWSPTDTILPWLAKGSSGSLPIQKHDAVQRRHYGGAG
jgi:hypothetical protein